MQFCPRCQFDYIEINNVNDGGFKHLVDKVCGKEIPNEFVSHQPKMEIIFRSDSTKNLNGFLAHYEFLGDSKYQTPDSQYIYTVPVISIYLHDYIV